MKALRDEAVTATFPTSVAQRRCWVMEQLQPGNRGLNLAIRWELRGPVSGDLVEAALQRITDRHEILRTRFVERNGEPVQEVVAHVPFRLGRFDLRAVPEADQETRIRAIAVEHAAERFDLSRPGLLRIAMVQTRADRAALLIGVHNSIFDGFSIGVLGHELGTTLAALAAGREPDLPPLALQYGDYALWLDEFGRSPAMEAEERYWCDRLRDMPYFEVPGDRPRSPAPPVSRTHVRDLPADFDRRMTEAARRLDLSAFALGTAAVSAALDRFAGRREVSFAIQAAGRDDVDLEPLIGIFTNPLVMRFDIAEGETLRSHAGKVRQVVEEALENQHLPFDRLVQRLNPPRDPLRIPLVSVMFNWQRAFLQERSYGPFELVSVPSHSPGTLYDLNINVIGRNAGWRVIIDYNAALFDESTIAEFATLFMRVMEDAAERPDTAISALPRPRRAVPPAGAAAPVPAARAGGGAAKERLAAIWAEVLGLPPEAVDGNFFDLGGYSVLALRMLARVADSFGTKPSLYRFLADPTLAGLAALLDGEAAADPAPAAPAVAAPLPKPAAARPAAARAAVPRPAPPPATRDPIWSLIELRKAPGDAPVLLTVNQTFLWQAMARDLEADCVVANLAIPDAAALRAEAEAGFDAAMEEAARVALTRYAGRPLLLCGLCVDGRAALRMAQALAAAGERPAAVAMIDTWAPGAAKELSAFTRWRDRWGVRARRLGYFLGQRLRGRISTRDVLRQYRLTAALLRRLGVIGPRPEMDGFIDATVDQLVQQSRALPFRPYRGAAMIFITEAEGAAARRRMLGWSALLPADTPVYPIRGWHGEALMRSGFDRIAAILAARLRRLAPGNDADDA